MRFPTEKAIVITLLTVLVMRAGYLWGSIVEQNRALKAGVAHWVVDPQTGVTAFVYEVPK